VGFRQALTGLGLIAVGAGIIYSAYRISRDSEMPESLGKLLAPIAVLFPLVSVGYWAWRIARQVRSGPVPRHRELPGKGDQQPPQ
jgi:hypothetical protein